MILWFRRSLPRQLLCLALISAALAGFDYWWAPTPPVRLRLPLLLQGLVAGLFIAIVAQSLTAATAFFSADFEPEATKLRERTSPRTFPAVLGALALTSIGEEALFRGYLLNAFLSRGILIAWSIHAAAVLAAHSAGRRRMSWTLIRFLEANFLAYAYLQSRSLAVCVAARLVLEISELVLFAPRSALLKGLKRRHVRLRRLLPLPASNGYSKLRQDRNGP